jgi:hypothetical protein
MPRRKLENVEIRVPRAGRFTVLGIAPWDHAVAFGRVEPVPKFRLPRPEGGRSAGGKMVAEADAGLWQLFSSRQCIA